MIANRTGSIITIISEAGRFGNQNSEVYAFAKAGAAGFMRSVARTNARFGIRANSGGDCRDADTNNGAHLRR